MNLDALRDLPDRWRKDAGVFARLDLWELGRVLERCARELEEALLEPASRSASQAPR